jgi:hypothetical protein
VKPVQKRFHTRAGKKITRLLASTMWFPTNKPKHRARCVKGTNN